LIFILVSLLTFFASNCKDPGYLKSPKNIKFIVRMLILILHRICYQVLIQFCYVLIVRLLELPGLDIVASVTDVLSVLTITVLG
jgi:hypothetical protein